MNERALDHVGIAVHSLDEALPVFESITGGKGYGRETVDSQGVEIVFVGSGAGRMELLAPTRPDSPVGKFLAKRGPGMHHVAYRVDDIRTALADAEEAGAQLIDSTPRRGMFGLQVAFIHPESVAGVLVELVQPTGEADRG